MKWVSGLKEELKGELDESVKADLVTLKCSLETIVELKEGAKAYKKEIKIFKSMADDFDTKSQINEAAFEELKEKYNNLVDETTVAEETTTFVKILKSTLNKTNIFTLRKELRKSLSSIEKKVGTISLHKKIE